MNAENISIAEVLDYVKPSKLNENTNYTGTQLGANIYKINAETDSINQLDILLVGCGERRGEHPKEKYSSAPDCIRAELFKLHYWHPNVKIGDLGNIKEGETLADTQAALKSVLSELYTLGKKVIVLGGSHDLTLQQYELFRTHDTLVDMAVIDMLADIETESETDYNSFLMKALTETPNFIRHFNLLGFQSYYVNPKLIETLDKLRFDCVRVGKAREDIEQMEPIFRNTHIVSLDINCVKQSDAPANRFHSPNGFYGDEVCKLTRFAGMSSVPCSLGIYGFHPEYDRDSLTSKLIAQMIWYFIDGVHVAKQEANLEDKDEFLEYHLTFTDVEAHFRKSKRTNRWWMKMPEGHFIPCTYQDYVSAANNEIPERWLREIERLV